MKSGNCGIEKKSESGNGFSGQLTEPMSPRGTESEVTHMSKKSQTQVKKSVASKVVAAVVLTVIQMKNLFLRGCVKTFISDLSKVIRHDEWNTRSAHNYHTGRIKDIIRQEGELPAEYSITAFKDADDPETLHVVKGHRTHLALVEMQAEDSVYYDKCIAPYLFVMVGETITDERVRDAIIADHAIQLGLEREDIFEELRRYVMATGHGSVKVIKANLNMIETLYPNPRRSKKVARELAEAKAAVKDAKSPIEKAIAEREVLNKQAGTYKGQIDSLQRAADMPEEVWDAYVRSELNQLGLVLDRSQIDKLHTKWLEEVNNPDVRCRRDKPSEGFAEAFENAKVESEERITKAKERKALAEKRPTAMTKDKIRTLFFNLPQTPSCEALRDLICAVNGIPLKADDWGSVPDLDLDAMTDILVAHDEDKEAAK